MLQIKTPLNAITTSASSNEALDSVVGTIRRHLPLFIVTVVCVVALGVAYLVTTPSSYTANGMLLLDTRRVQVLDPQQTMMGGVVIDAGTVQTEIEILKSENVSLSVIRKLNLAHDPEFVVGSTGPIGVTLRFVSGLFSSGAPLTDYQLERKALKTFEKNSTIDRVGLTYVMEIGFRSVDPAKASLIANSIAEAYIDDQLDAKYQSTRRASLWLQARISELRTQASQADQAVADFKQKNNIVSIVDQQGHRLNDQQLVDANNQLSRAHAATTEAKARLDRIQEVLKDPVNSSGVADAQTNGVIIKLRQQLLDLTSREAIWSAKYGKNHLAAVDLRNQMSEVRRNIQDEVQKIAQSYKSDYDIAVAHETALNDSVASAVQATQSTDEAQVQLSELQSNAYTYKTLYTSFLQRYMEAIQQQSFPITESRLITEAARPSTRSSPNSLIIAPVTAILALMIAFGIAFVLEYLDGVFRTAAQIERRLGTICIGLLPTLKMAQRQRSGVTATAREGQRTIEIGLPVYRHAVTSPLSAFAETLRAMKVTVDLQSSSGPRKVIGISSTLPKEGKSTVSANFAELIAQSGATCLLIDADLRRPSLTWSLAPQAKAGFVDVAAGAVSFEDAIWSDPLTGLHFLPAGQTKNIYHTGDLLGSEGVRDLIDNLRKCYDYIIVDLSPLAPVVDTRVTGAFIDGFIHMVEWGRTPMDLVERALAGAPEVRDLLLGVVMTKVDIRKLGRYEKNRRYHYMKYYAKQGYLSDVPA